MWILNWLPDIVFHVMLLVGILAIVASFVLSSSPFLWQYKLPIQIAGIVLVVVAVWYEGGIAKDKEYKARIASLELKISKAEAESADANARLAEEVLKHQQSIEKITAANKQRLNNQAADLNQSCRVNDTVIGILNDAAKARNGGAK
jgi:hypothetical protein